MKWKPSEGPGVSRPAAPWALLAGLWLSVGEEGLGTSESSGRWCDADWSSRPEGSMATDSCMNELS